MTITADPPPTIRQLIADLKGHGQDFEFYPTTPAMIKTILDHITNDEFYEAFGKYRRRYDIKTVLDVGAGAGAFLKAAAEHERYRGAELLAIEKSQILISQLVGFCKVIGTDFHAQTFLPKQVDVLFSNPPYLEYETWTTRLIKECPAEMMYFIIPSRWKDSANINAAIKFRNAQVAVIDSADFLEADRRSRAKVDILFVLPQHERHRDRDDEDDAEDMGSLFSRFFLEKFGHLKDKMKKSADETAKEQTQRRQGLVERDGLVGALVQLYNAEMDRLHTNYEKAASMDAELLMELGLSINSIINTLSTKLDCLKQRYWQELFSNLDTVTNRLTSKNRSELLDTIGGFKAVDFTSENIYAVLLWILEHANKYVDSQILSVFDTLLSHANMRNYKSNAKVYEKGRYRYQDEKPTHVSLDFRLVVDGWYGFRSQYSWEKSNPRLSETANNLVDDILCVANLLGFPHHESPRGSWQPGKPVLFLGLDGEDVAEFKAFKNGNMHIRMSQRLMMALNVAVGKLRGWIRNHHEATEEFGEGAAEEYAKDLHMAPKQLLLSMGPTK